MEQKFLLRISLKTDGRCFYCNAPGEVVDHFISKKKWEEWNLENTSLKEQLNRIENLFLACGKCNASKNDKAPEDFMRNSFKCWSRYSRANKRIGIDIKDGGKENLYGFGGITPMWIEKEINKRNLLFYEI